MKTIIVPNVKSDSLTHQLEVFYKTFKDIYTDEKITFDLSKIDWIYPLAILPIASHIYATKSAYKTSFNDDINFYLDTIHFPEGVSSLKTLQNIKKDCL